MQREIPLRSSSPGGPIGTNSFGDSVFFALWCVWNAKRAKRKLLWTFWDAWVASVVDFGFCCFWIFAW